MTSEQLLAVVNEAIYRYAGKRLSDVETAILQGAIADQTYEQISAVSGYSISYVKRDVGPKLWRTLSDALGEPVSKTNFRSALDRWQAKYISPSLSSPQGGPSFAAGEPANPAAFAATAGCAPVDIYIERPPIEAVCYDMLQQPGALLRLKAPNLMGKTRLIGRLLAQLNQLDYRTINLSLSLADTSVHFSDINRFMRWFCSNLSHELGLPSQLDDYWNEAELGAKISCTTYLEEYLLPQANTPLVLCLDDVDLLFPYPAIYEDFFGLLRSWHEKAKSRPLWKQLRLVLAHATDVYIRLNINSSPFNVGVPIELPEFTLEQAQEFANQYGLSINTLLIEALMGVIGGHPYLLQQTFAYLKHHPDVTLPQVLAEATTPISIYGHHLRERWLNLQAQPDLLNAFKAVILASGPAQLDPMAAYQLHRMGLVKFSGNQVMPCCYLYRNYFGEWLEKSSVAPSL